MINGLAQQGEARAEHYLGIMYQLGMGAEKNPAIAEKWFEKAASHHNPEGEYAIGTLLSIQPDHVHDFARAVENFRHSAKAGYVASMHSLGLLLVNHPEIPQERGEAIHWLQVSAEAGTWKSSAVLGILSRDGKGLPKDSVALYRWFSIALQQGKKPAEDYLSGAFKQARDALTAGQITQADADVADWIAKHGHRDVFVFPGERDGYFPLNEIYAINIPHQGTSLSLTD
jgi:hypothetical protein